MPATIEKASVGDLDKLCEIEKRCFQSEAFTRQQMAHLLTGPNSICLVTKLKEEIIGFVMGEIYRGKKPTEGHILTVDVPPEHRRKGIGQKLLQSIEKTFKDGEVKICYLEVREDNIAALSLYKKIGYKQTKKLKNYYGNGHGLLLEKILT